MFIFENGEKLTYFIIDVSNRIVNDKKDVIMRKTVVAASIIGAMTAAAPSWPMKVSTWVVV
ncbi:hypothetical protein JCM19239_5785 [Vibrio variabilis]|uniref:Uncharacterized protein n=1 Tax=Vibrio variabilis TaxID=990271 RepID=A0ABQ0JIK2_9VIBR|nr:hypothetical protein JCM19239_5785 [Vibrio variabilis]